MINNQLSPDKKKYKNSGNRAALAFIPSEAKYILDIGCGCGDNAKILFEKGCIVDCITISLEEKEIAKSYCNRVFIKNLENGLPHEILNRKYDVVLCSHVIEHIAYPEILLNDLKKVLISKKSLLIVAIPNFLSYRNRFKIFFGKFEYEKSGIMDYTHLRWYTYKTGRNLLEYNGFKVNRVFVDGNIPFARIFNWLNDSIKNIILKILFYISPGLFGGQFIYLCTIDNED